MIPLEFLRELWGGKSARDYILIWVLQTKMSFWRRTPEEAAQVIAGLGNNVDIYVGVGLAPKDYGARARCPSIEITTTAGVWADFDLASPAHPKALPATLAEALSLIPPGFEPTLVVSTGNGCHVYWLWKEIVLFASAEERAAAERAAAERLVYRWQNMLRLAAAGRGWSFDRLADLARVLRVPGTRNYKDPANPRPVTLAEYSGRRYNPSDFEWYLDQLGIPGPEEPAQGVLRSVAAVSSGPSSLRIDLNARIDPKLIELWIEGDARFGRTWFRQRTDMPDQSQSGYDLALADFGFDVKLSPQEIVNLIIQHRRLHRQKPRTRVDYFERTLARAATRGAAGTEVGTKTEEAEEEDAPSPAPPSEVEAKVEAAVEARVEPAAEASAGAPNPPAPSASPQPPPALDPLAKALLIEKLGHDLGIPLLRIRKSSGEKPIYFFDFTDGSSLKIASASILLDQYRLKVAIAGSSLDLQIPGFKAAAWRQIVDVMLRALTPFDMGQEREPGGDITTYLTQYLREIPFLKDLNREPARTRQRPVVIGGQIAINTVDLRAYLQGRQGVIYAPSAIAEELTQAGAVPRRVPIPGTQGQARWFLPPERFPVDEYYIKAADQEPPSDE